MNIHLKKNLINEYMVNNAAELERDTTGFSSSSMISCACLNLTSTTLAGSSASIKM